MLDLIIIPVFLLSVCVCTGYVILNVVKKDYSFAKIIITGYIFCIGVFHLIAIPFMFFHLSFLPLYYLSIGYFIIVILCALYLIYKNRFGHKVKKKVLDCRNLIYKEKWKFILLVIIGICIIYQVIWVVYFQHTDIDDSYYLAEINSILQTNKIHSVEPASGIEGFNFQQQYALVSYEVLLSIIVKLFHVNTAFFAHTILPIFLIPLHYIVIYSIGKTIRNDVAEIFTLLYCMCNLFSGYSGYSQGAFLLFRIWQGKAVMINIVIPILLLWFMQLYKCEKVKKYDIVFLTLILISGMHSTTVALYLLPIAYFPLAVSFFLIKKNVREMLKLCIPIFLIFPLVVLKGLILFVNQRGMNDTTSIAYGIEKLSSYIEFLQMFLNNNWIILLAFAIAVVYILLCGNEREKGIVGIPPIVLFATFLNPYLVGYVAHYITSVAVYWRLFWLFQIPMAIVVMIVIIIDKERKNGIINMVISGILLISICGTYILEIDDEKFTYRSNKYKLDSQTVEITEWVRDDAEGNEVILLVPVELSYGVREYCGDVQLLMNRYSEGIFLGAEKEEDYKRLENKLISMLYVDKSWDVSDLKKELNYFNIDYFIVCNDSLENNQLPVGVSIVRSGEMYTLVKNN